MFLYLKGIFKDRFDSRRSLDRGNKPNNFYVDEEKQLKRAYKSFEKPADVRLQKEAIREYTVKTPNLGPLKKNFFFFFYPRDRYLRVPKEWTHVKSKIVKPSILNFSALPSSRSRLVRLRSTLNRLNHATAYYSDSFLGETMRRKLYWQSLDKFLLNKAWK